MIPAVAAICQVFPMRVGMNRMLSDVDAGEWSVPHACGDEPGLPAARADRPACSPCVWG